MRINRVFWKIYWIKETKKISSEASINPDYCVFPWTKEQLQREIKGKIKKRNAEDTKKLNALHREIFCPVIAFLWETEIRKEGC